MNKEENLINSFKKELIAQIEEEYDLLKRYCYEEEN